MNVIWTKQACPFCRMAKTLLDKHSIQYEEREIGKDWTREQLLEAVPTARTVPQIFLDNQYIGTYENLKSHFNL